MNSKLQQSWNRLLSVLDIVGRTPTAKDEKRALRRDGWTPLEIHNCHREIRLPVYNESLTFKQNYEAGNCVEGRDFR